MTIPLLVRQIEGLKLLQKTRKPQQDEDKRVRTALNPGPSPGSSGRRVNKYLGLSREVIAVLLLCFSISLLKKFSFSVFHILKYVMDHLLMTHKNKSIY